MLSNYFFPAQSEDERTVTLQVDGEETTLEFVKSEDFQVIKYCICLDLSRTHLYEGVKCVCILTHLLVNQKELYSDVTHNFSSCTSGRERQSDLKMVVNTTNAHTIDMTHRIVLTIICITSLSLYRTRQLGRQ